MKGKKCQRKKEYVEGVKCNKENNGGKREQFVMVSSSRGDGWAFGGERRILENKVNVS